MNILNSIIISSIQGSWPVILSLWFQKRYLSHILPSWYVTHILNILYFAFINRLSSIGPLSKYMWFCIFQVIYASILTIVAFTCERYQHHHHHHHLKHHDWNIFILVNRKFEQFKQFCVQIVMLYCWKLYGYMWWL